MSDRPEMEATLARALSRHIGYTTGAYGLDRILSVLDFFRDRSSAYREEIIAFIRSNSAGSEKELTDEYLNEILTFARAFGIIESVSPKESRLQKYSCPELGRSLLSAKSLEDKEFFRFFVARTAFLADSDSLFCVLSYFSEPREIHLHDYYIKFFSGVRNERMEWLYRAFSEPLLLARISDRLSWIGRSKKGGPKDRVESLTTNTARHHATPRKGWLAAFDMLDSDTNSLTSFGRHALRALAPNGQYFWLGPPRFVQEQLRIEPSNIHGGPYEDEFAFTAELPPANDKNVRALLPEVARIMIEAYSTAKLIHASQASIHLPIEYIIYRSYKDNVAYAPLDILDRVFHDYRDTIDRFSALKGKIGFYRVRSSAGQ